MKITKRKSRVNLSFKKKIIEVWGLGVDITAGWTRNAEESAISGDNFLQGPTYRMLEDDTSLVCILKPSI